MPAPTDPGPADLPPPALDDPVTAALLDTLSRRIKATLGYTVAAALLLALVAGTLIATRSVTGTASAYAILLVVAACLALLFYAVRVRSLIPSLRAAHDLLATQAWRPVPVSTVGRAIVELTEGGDRLAVRLGLALPKPIPPVIAGSGRVWVVGPDPAGRLVLRFDGLATPYPARRVTP